MKNFEKILEKYEDMVASSEYSIYKFTREDIYKLVPKDVQKIVSKEWDYELYNSEEAQFADKFLMQFSSFLYRVQHWSSRKIKENGFYGTEYVAEYKIKEVMQEWKGARAFELWLLGEENVDIELPTSNRENINSNSPLDVLLKNNTYTEDILKNMEMSYKGRHFAYLMYLYKDEENIPTFLKVGKSSQIRQRQLQLIQQYHLDRIEVIKTFEFTDSDTAEMMESFLRKYYKAKYQGKNFTPKDRFKEGVCSDKELIYFEKKARLIAAAAEL